MNSDLKRIMLLKLSFVTLTSYTTIFISYFFWEKTGELNSIILFTGLQYLFWFLPYTLGIFLLLKNLKYNYFLSSLSSFLMFIVLWFYSDSLAPFSLMIIIALFTGLTSAFFYASNTVGMLHSAESSLVINRFISLEGSLTNLISFLLPIINGFIIVFFGFEWSFVFMGLVSLFYLYLSISIPSNKKIEWSLFQESFKNEKLSVPMMWFNFIAIFSSRGTLLLGTLLLVFISANELQMSLWNALSVAVIFLIGFLIRRYPGITSTTWIHINFVLLVITSLIILFDFNFIFVVLFLAVITYISRYTERSLPFKVIRRSNLEGKAVLTYKRGMIINIARVVMYGFWYVIYHFVTLETLFLLILVSAFLSILITKRIALSIEKQIK